MLLQMVILIFVIISQNVQLAADEFGFEGHKRRLNEQKLIQKLLEGGPEPYNYRIRPRGTLDSQVNDPAVENICNLYLRSISEIDDVQNKITLQITLRQEWIDERLLYFSPDLKKINLLPGQKIWLPDTFFQNEQSAKKHEIDQPNIFLVIFNGTGKVLYSSRITLTLDCPMVLTNFPFDTQKCSIDFAPFAYTTSDIVYSWKNIHPIQIKDRLFHSFQNFIFSTSFPGKCTSVTNTGTYSCLEAIFVFKRDFKFYLSQIYILSIILVCASWISFWLKKNFVLMRITIGVVSLLILSIQVLRISKNLPNTSHMKSIDIWINACFAFIFATILEFALVHWAQNEASSKDNHYRHVFVADGKQDNNVEVLISDKDVDRLIPLKH